MLRKILVTGTVALAGGLAVAPGAGAGAPIITTTTRVVAPSPAREISRACGFTVLQTFTLETRRLSFTDDTGAEVRRIGHSTFDGYLIKASTGEALPYSGVWTQTLDVADGTITIDGLRQDVRSANGAPVLMVGHAVYPVASFPLSPLEASERAEFADWWPAVCPAFSS